MKPLNDCSVLILESDFGVGLELMRALGEEGCRAVKLVRTVEGALQELSLAMPDAATLDLDTHGKRSLPLTETLAANDVPVVIVSCRTVSRQVNGRRPPVCQKPIAVAEVVSLLTSAIARRKAA
jgi:DNA-binding response OmpR family regulator